jgi:hypothetical protein
MHLARCGRRENVVVRALPVMPGQTEINTAPVPDGVDFDELGAVATFRDAGGISWRARPDGQLDDLSSGQPKSQPRFRRLAAAAVSRFNSGQP